MMFGGITESLLGLKMRKLGIFGFSLRLSQRHGVKICPVKDHAAAGLVPAFDFGKEPIQPIRQIRPAFVVQQFFSPGEETPFKPALVLIRHLQVVLYVHCPSHAGKQQRC